MKTFWLFLRPSYIKITLMIVLTLASLAVTTKFEATSKVTWDANRGFPLPFITLSEYVFGGRCLQNSICVETNIREFNPYAMILDVLAWYLVSCVIVFISLIVKKYREAIRPNP